MPELVLTPPLIASGDCECCKQRPAEWLDKYCQECWEEHFESDYWEAANDAFYQNTQNTVED